MDLQRDEVEAWFRGRGLPLIVHRSEQRRALITRTAPAVVFLAGIFVILIVLYGIGTAPEAEDPTEPTIGYVDTVILLPLVPLTFLVLPSLAAWVTRGLLRRLSGTVGLTVGCVIVVVAASLVPVLAEANDFAPYLDAVITAVTVVALLLLLTRLGVGAIVVWASRKALQQVRGVGAMASRVLPLLLLAVLLAFFTGELWQAANSLSRAQMWVVVAFLAVIALGFMITTFSDELPALREASRTRTDLATRLQDTPLAGCTAPAGRNRLTRPERLNVVLVLFLAQAVQVVAFAAVVFAFFVVFGLLMITPATMESYLAGAPHAEATLFGLPIPVSNALFQVSLFLAAFSGLYFTASKTTDERYRQAFYEPLIDEIALSLAARDIYRERWPR
ncbi:hypothetical protein ACQEVB_20720 [Pseudonocardia sp. CA-107938]|uniref:hypothetical protein n=1 Tax=Pseudonocardia sp. CA-107938 TaxID=3240021 RepID=UPI003D8DD843